MTAKFPQSAGQIQYNAESSSVEKPSAQWRENRHASLQIQNENYRPESGQYATRFEGYPGAEHPGQSTGHDQCLHSPRPEEDGLWPPTSYSSTLSAKPIGPSQTPMSTNRGIATPLSCLSRAAAQVDCPNCSHRTMTNISYEVGNTTQYVTMDSGPFNQFLLELNLAIACGLFWYVFVWVWAAFHT